MIKIIVKNNANVIMFDPIFETQDLADAWLNRMLSARVFGKPERWVREGEEDTSNALETLEVEDLAATETEPAITHIEYRLPAEYTIEQEDVSAQVEQEEINRQALQYLVDTDWYIIREMDEGTPCPSEIKAERAAARSRIQN